MPHDREALWNTGHDESVEVNQRALIDKVLARYSGEFTVFRELLQNSDDAGSSAAEIRFETASYLRRKEGGVGNDNPHTLPDLKTALVTQWTFRNDGIAFRDEDWSRLRKIAEGNPDEEKIGAFGVGFYSLFSVTENPFVSSGGHGMQFYWKDNKDQLHVRRGDLPSKGNSDPWTTFEMTLREASPIPSPFDLMRFLASSITFMVHLKDVRVYFDEFRIGHLTKASGAEGTVDIPKGLKRSSGLNIMHVQTVQSHHIRIDAEVMQAVYAVGAEKRPVLPTQPRKSQSGFFSSLIATFTSTSTSLRQESLPPATPLSKDLTEVRVTSVTLTIFNAEVNVKVDKKLSAELLRSTKKNPPQQLRYSLIYTGKDEYDQSIAAEKDQPDSTSGSIFQGLRADLNGSGQARVFIGHATAQTTGIGGHMAARFIPTVERESIDLVDKNVAVWNRELLYVGGFLSRVAYDLELANINALWEGARSSSGTLDMRPTPELEDWLRQRFLHVLKFFTFHPSTPSFEVSRLLETAFYGCSSSPLKLLSSTGVRSVVDVKEPDPTFSQFLKYLPVLPEAVMKEGALTIRALQNQGMISCITFHDVLSELRQHPLNEKELVACLKWWCNLPPGSSGVDMDRLRAELLNTAVLCPSNGDRALPLSSFLYFINNRNIGVHIPLDGPLPVSLMPLGVTQHFTPAQLVTFRWRELTIIEWLRHVTSPAVMVDNPAYDFTKSVEWAERVLTILSRVWLSLSSETHGAVKAIFTGKKCIPTTCGLQAPEAAYFPTVKIFSDLPVVQLSSTLVLKGQMEKMLSGIGIRRHVDLQLVFNRMIKTGDWSVPDLVGYLVTVKDDLSPEEVSRLSATSAFCREGDLGDPQKKKTRYCARDLYEPIDIFRQLNLPVLEWSGEKAKWRSTSEEAKLLFRFGLRRFPPLTTVVELCTSPNPAVREVAFKYLCNNIPTKYPEYRPEDFAKFAFIPADNEDGPHLGTIREVFANPQWKLLGFSVVQPDCQNVATSKLGVQEHPPSSMLLSLLEKTPPQNESMARQWFEILSERVTNFRASELAALSKTPIVPCKGSGSQPIRWLAPTQCYLGVSTKGQFHSKLFIFVDFGSAANRFLSACGSRNEPSVEEVAEILIADPNKFYNMTGGYENFLTELRNLAINCRLLSNATVNKMKNSPVLLGVCRQKPKEVAENKQELGEDGWEFQHSLRRARDIVIADDTNAYQLFGDSIFTAPQEDLLEDFYIWLGCKRLSLVVREEYKVSNEIPRAKTGMETRALVLERLPLFLHEHTHARTTVSLAWLSKPENFKVRVFGTLTIVKTLDMAGIRTTRTQDASAAAKRPGQGTIELWLSSSGKVDMYEVATSLCRLLFETVKVNDALLFMTILSTDLKALKRRGYNVDKILKRQQHERKLAEEARNHFIDTESSLVPIQPAIPTRSTFAPTATKSPTRPPVPPGGWEPGSPPVTPQQPQSTEIPKEIEAPSDKDANTAQPFRNTLQNLTRKLVAMAPQNITQEVTRAVQPQRSRPVTPQSHIRSNVNMAISACRPEQEKLLRNRQKMEIIKEAVEEGYCDVTHTGEFTHLGTVGETKIFVTTDVPDTANFMTQKRNTIARFIHVIAPLSNVYNLPMTVCHIFYDNGGGLIAFNRNGSLFLNLRYFEAWHDEDVKNGNLAGAQISWFFTLAHELAHNLVEAHNSEHEFYFAAICEAHTIAFSKLLASSTATGS